MSRKSSIIFTFTEQQSINNIIYKLTLFQWIRNVDYIVEIKQSDKGVEVYNEFNFDNWNICIKDKNHEILDHYHLLFLSNSINSISSIILFQYGDEFRNYLLKIINDKEQIKGLVNLLESNEAFFSYEGDGEEFAIPLETLEMCITNNDFSILERCMVYPKLQYKWLYVDNI